MHDIAIVGGGPGGLYAAYQLARYGFDVAVCEEHHAAGNPVHCTGVLAVEAFDEFDVSWDAIINSLITAEFFGPSGKSISYSTAAVEAVVVDRCAFDASLCDRARSAGATIRVGARVADVRVSAAGVVVSSADGSTVEARACVLACGA